MTKTRILSWLVLALALLNVGLLALLWLGHPGRRGAGPPAAGSVATTLERELQLTASQQAQFRTLRETHQAQMQALLRELIAQREQLFTGLAQPATAAASPALLARIGTLQRQTDSLTFAHFAAVGRLLTPAQLPRWQRLAPTLPRLLQPPGPGGRPPGPGRRSGGPSGEGPPPGMPEPE